MPTIMVFEIFRQLFNKPATNKFPVKYAPKNMHAAAKAIEKGNVKITPPVKVPKDFRGKVAYDREACIGCKMCIKMCPSNAIEWIPGPGGKAKGSKVKFYMSRCTFCEMCVEICPKECIKMTQDFMMSDADKESANLVITDSGKFAPQEK
ncbi:MAG: 4Fe-4S binding protein [Candidatus Thermoplasmatota archaeon]|nr:4Fe-4S binding protein [Candidatus Thermoplasmatota archaeon]